METTIGAALLVLYLVTIPVLLRIVPRNGRPGLLTRNGQIELAMLAHIALLLAGGILVLLGLDVGT